MGRKKTRKEYIKLARTVHGDKYDYRWLNYKRGADKVKIRCKKM